MTSVIDIARFEFRRLFMTPLAWMVLAAGQFILAMLFYTLLSEYLQQPAVYAGRGMTEVVVAGFYQSAAPILLLMTPFITMRSVSEDRRVGTIQLLLSSPLPVTRLVLGKYLGILLFMLCLLLLCSLMPLSLGLGTPLVYGHFAAAATGLALLLAAAAAAGLFVSTLFRHAAAAAVVTFALFVLLWTIHAAGAGGGRLDPAYLYLSLLRHYAPLTEGMIASMDVLYFLILTGSFLALGVWRLDALRTHHW